MNNDQFVLAGDVGGTNLRVAAVNAEGVVRHLSENPTPRDGTGADIAAAIIEGAGACIAALDDSKPNAFGLALPALIHYKRGTVLSSPNLPQLNGIDLAQIVAVALGFPVILENDATAAAIGEHWLGSSSSVDNSVFVTLGTGVGGGLILDGRPYRGADGTAGEIGHICIEPDGLACGCGSRGCVEQYASATAILRIANELEADAGSAKVYRSSKAVFEAATAGDGLASEAFTRMGRYLGLALAGLVDVLNPEMIVIGGGPSGAWEFFIEPLRGELFARAFRHPAESVRIMRASLGESAGIYGAARVGFDCVDH